MWWHMLCSPFSPGSRSSMRICELIGRSVGKGAGESQQVVEAHPAGREQVHDEDSKEELSGVVLGRSIEDALPSELSACGGPELETLFDLKFIKGRLLSFARTKQSCC